jgi:hypothetical protein
LWGHALGMTPDFSQLLDRSHGWLHEHYPLVGLRYVEALLALVVVIMAVRWGSLEPGTVRHRLLKWLRAMALTLVALHFVLPGGTSASTVPAGQSTRRSIQHKQN